MPVAHVPSQGSSVTTLRASLWGEASQSSLQMPFSDPKAAYYCHLGLGTTNISRLNVGMWILQAPDRVSGILYLKALHAFATLCCLPAVGSVATVSTRVSETLFQHQHHREAIPDISLPELAPTVVGHRFPLSFQMVSSMRTGTLSIQSTAGCPVQSLESCLTQLVLVK